MLLDESYLSHSDSVVLSLNPFFVLSSDVTPRNDPQLSRASSLILSSLLFIHDLRNGLLKPDAVRSTPLDMSQYERLFATCRVPTDLGCRMESYEESRHIVVIRRGQFCEYPASQGAQADHTNYGCAQPVVCIVTPNVGRMAPHPSDLT